VVVVVKMKPTVFPAVVAVVVELKLRQEPQGVRGLHHKVRQVVMGRHPQLVLQEVAAVQAQ
jgi:hypothetical protein